MVMLGTEDYHTKPCLWGLKYETRIDAFFLALIRCLKETDPTGTDTKRIAWVPYESIFEKWEEAHIEILETCYGATDESAMLKTESWLTQVQVVGQAIKEYFIPYVMENVSEYITRKGTKTCHLVDRETIVTAHVSIYEGKLRSESAHLFLDDWFAGRLYKEVLAEWQNRPT